MNFRKLFVRFLWWAGVLSWGDWLCSQIRRHQNNRKVLLINLDGIGDFVLWIAAAEDLRNLYPKPKYEIVLLGNEEWTSLAERMVYFDSIVGLDRRRFVLNPVYRWKLLAKIRLFGFGIVISPTYSRDFLWADAVVRASGASERIGFSGDDFLSLPIQKKLSNRWYTSLVSSEAKPLMQLQRNAEFVNGLGSRRMVAKVTSLPDFRSLPVALDNKKYYVLFPGSKRSIKRWPLENFSDIVRRLSRRTGMIGVICGGTNEAQLGEELAKLHDGKLENWVGRTSLVELVSIIQHAQFVISNDSSAVHIAAATNTPAVCIVGGGHFGRYFPYRVDKQNDSILPVAVYNRMDCFNCNWNCIYRFPRNEPAPCINYVSTNAVWKKVQDLIRY